ncbi:MAG: carboxypeptidase regulatory-like domain-containing protein, partial [Candidatus Thorarchaeota archaeon]|nr:carboxypeptidase regulatory-like domain-containing protein [Candidatus Thorarchaeota archaeon]
MKFKKRNLILSILVLSIFLLQSTALASAIYRPPGGDPPPTTTTYRVYGYVTDVDTGLPINGARVKIYRGTTSYIGQDYTDSNGYYNFYYRTTLTITKVKSVASKSGYYTSSRVGYMLEGR